MSSPHSALPTSADVETALANMQVPITLPTGFDADSEVAAAIDEWDRRTGYRPFFQAGASTRVMYVDPPGPDRSTTWGGGGALLFLPTGLLSLTSLVNQYDPTTTPATFNTLTQNLDFWLLPSIAPTQVPAEPYTQIKFQWPQRGNPGSIGITGLWGYCEGTLPDDAWKAIRDLATVNCLKELIASLPTQWSSISELDSHASYTPDILNRLGAALMCKVERTLMRYRLLAF